MTTALEQQRSQAPLSTQLRERTAEAHENAEGSRFMSALISGELTRDAVVDYTGQLWFIYETLERAVRRVADSRLGSAVAGPRLERRNSLESDLAAMIGADWRRQVRILPETAGYVSCLENLDSPGGEVGVVAHHYVRYLGDVSGGQIISRKLQALYGLSAEELNFYDFSSLGKIKPYRDGYRQRIDELELSGTQRERLIREAVEAFSCNFRVFSALESRHC